MLDETDVQDLQYYVIEVLQLQSFIQYGLTYQELFAAYTEDTMDLFGSAMSKWKALSESMDAIAQKLGCLDGWHGMEKPQMFVVLKNL